MISNTAAVYSSSRRSRPPRGLSDASWKLPGSLPEASGGLLETWWGVSIRPVTGTSSPNLSIRSVDRMRLSKAVSSIGSYEGEI